VRSGQPAPEFRLPFAGEKLLSLAGNYAKRLYPALQDLYRLSASGPSMQKIYPVALPPSAPRGTLRAARTTDAGTMAPVSAGDTLEATVVEKIGPSKYLISVNNSSLIADADLLLRAGEKLTVRVEQSVPPLLLRIVGRDAASVALFNEYLRFHRANPEGLLEIFRTGPEVLKREATSGPIPDATRAVLRSVAKIIDSLFCSPDSLKNPLFIKNYVSLLGLTLEGRWRDLLQQDKGAKNLPSSDNLKGLLLKLAEELRVLMKESGTADREELQKLVPLAKFTEASIRAIETQQVVNAGAPENDNRYLVQIPLLFPDGVRPGEIFIEAGKKGQGREDGKNRFRVVMFLSMDQLGDMMVDATLCDNRIGCLFKFSEPEAVDFFAPLLDGLGENLRQAGYECDFLTCMAAGDLAAARQECHRQMTSELDAINLYI